MSFSWSETIIKNDDIDASHVIELRANISTIRSQTGLLGYPWASLISSDIEIQSSQIQELRTALDQAKNANICSADNVTHYASYCPSHLTSYCTAHYSYCTSYFTSYCAAHYTNYNGSYLVHYYAGNYYDMIFA